MMKNAANWAAMAAFLFGLIGFYLYTARLAERLGGGPVEGSLVVTRDLAPGQTLSEDDLGEVELPARYFDPRRVLSADKKKVLGLALETPLRAGEGLVWSDLRDGAAHQSLAALISPGHRAYNVSHSANPLGRLLQVGDRVDVLLERAGKSEVLLHRVLVLSVGGRLAESTDEASSNPTRRNEGVTLSVTQPQATQLFAASSRGQLLLVLRNPDDEFPRAEAPTPPKVTQEAQVRALLPEKKEIEHVR